MATILWRSCYYIRYKRAETATHPFSTFIQGMNQWKGVWCIVRANDVMRSKERELTKPSCLVRRLLASYTPLREPILSHVDCDARGLFSTISTM